MPHRNVRWLVLGGALVAGAAHALASDKQQPIHIEADSVVIDDGRGLATYRGSVHYSQGSTHLLADEVVVHSAARKQVDKVEARGAPTTFRQRPDNKDEDMRGQATRNEKNAEKQREEKEDAAHLWQGQNEFSGD